MDKNLFLLASLLSGARRLLASLLSGARRASVVVEMAKR
jgi:hypothetical protein